MQDLRLYSTSKDREKYEAMADIFSIFFATECLEKAYIKDTVGHKEYLGFLVLLNYHHV